MTCEQCGGDHDSDDCVSVEALIETRKELTRVSYSLACVLDHATGGRLSKTNYTKEVMYEEIDDWVNRQTQEIEEKLAALEDESRQMEEMQAIAFEERNQARAKLAIAVEAIEAHRKAQDDSPDLTHADQKLYEALTKIKAFK